MSAIRHAIAVMETVGCPREEVAAAEAELKELAEKLRGISAQLAERDRADAKLREAFEEFASNLAHDDDNGHDFGRAVERWAAKGGGQ